MSSSPANQGHMGLPLLLENTLIRVMDELEGIYHVLLYYAVRYLHHTH